MNKSDNSTQWTLVIPIYHEALDMLGLGKLSRIISGTMKAVLWPVQCTQAAPDDALVEEEGEADMQSSSLASLQTPSCDGGEHYPLIILAVSWEIVV